MLSKHATQLRYRKQVLTKGDLIGIMNVPITRFKRLPTRVKCYALLAVILLLLFLYYAISSIFQNHLTREDFLETNKCPACFGMSLCFDLFNGHATLSGISKLPFLHLNMKNAYFGQYGQHKVVLKKLALNRELRSLDNQICRDARRPPNCDVGRVVHIASYYSRSNEAVHLTVNVTKGISDMMTCPTTRLLNRIKRMYKERSASDRLLYRDKIMLLTTLRVNPEPIMLQTFPASEGWPFPEYFGACGRFIVARDCGRTLDHFYDAPFHDRLNLAYQILKMADMLSDNEYQFALYWSDLQYTNFAVDDNGKVTMVDVENVIVVDKLSIKKEKKANWDVYLEHRYNPSECRHHHACMTYVPEDLCTHADSDHNYFAACSQLLAPSAEPGRPFSGGLLHDMPDSARDDWELEHLLMECTIPTRYKGRQHAKDKLLFTLNKLRVIYLSKHPERYKGHFDQ